jgi:putative MATE family efflux protein
MGTISNGGIGGGVSSAVSRALGAGRHGEADALLVHAIAVALLFGLTFTTFAYLVGPDFYAALGAEGASLSAALTFSAWVFGGAPLIWVASLMASAMRGAGDVRLTALVSLAGAAVLIPLSPLLIFGASLLPAMGVAGAGLATLIYYAGALIAYIRHLRKGRGGLALRRVPLERPHFALIMGVGSISALGTLLASLTAVALTGVVGMAGQDALAGYGIPSRVDSLLVPLIFALGSGVVTIVGAASGAGLDARAARVAWTGAVVAFAAATITGVLLAITPDLWMAMFSGDEDVLDWGRAYLRVNGPFYGFAAAGLLLYFAAQGRGRMAAPFVAALARLIATAGGGYAILASGWGLEAAFVAVASGSVLFAAINAAGLRASFRAPIASRPTHLGQ